MTLVVFRHCGDFLSLKVICWTGALNDSHVPLLAIIAIQHSVIHLFKRSKDKERVHYGIMVKDEYEHFSCVGISFSFACLTMYDS